MTVLINSLVNAPHGKYEINKTIKIVDFFKVYSWGLYSLGILDGSPNLTLLSLNGPGHPTHSLYTYTPTPTPSPVRHDVTFLFTVLYASWTFYAGNLHLFRSGGFVLKSMSNLSFRWMLGVQKEVAEQCGGFPAQWRVLQGPISLLVVFCIYTITLQCHFTLFNTHWTPYFPSPNSYLDYMYIHRFRLGSFWGRSIIQWFLQKDLQTTFYSSSNPDIFM